MFILVIKEKYYVTNCNDAYGIETSKDIKDAKKYIYQSQAELDRISLINQLGFTVRAIRIEEI